MIPSEQAKGKLTTAFLDYYYLLLLCIPGRSSHKYSYLPHLNLFPLPRHMCDYFWQRMENDQGDLTDIVRAGSRAIPSATELRITDWQLPPEAAAFPASAQLGPTNDFGDPFFNFRDPLINELAGVELFNGATEAVAGCNAGAGGCGGLASQKALIEEDIKRPCNIFSRVLQISPGIGKPLPVLPVAASEMLKINSSSSLVACPVDSGGRVQISSPPQTPGIKRRKSQAKKVVCIPAPAAASNRPSGEVVPSDLWAWRKYGQKPIKGSPYPRGYYRCSSSKGCSARKQVERSRTDPNMLVITYTSEHNHPWPTQRNALAGSTRSQPSKNGSKQANSNLRPSTGTKEGSKEMSGSNITALVKEEVVPEMENSAIDSSEDNELDLVFHQSYKSVIPDASRPEDFLSDFAELDPDPMSLIFSRGLMEAKPEEEKGENVMNPFSIFEWAGSSIGNAKKNL